VGIESLGKAKCCLLLITSSRSAMMLDLAEAESVGFSSWAMAVSLSL